MLVFPDLAKLALELGLLLLKSATLLLLLFSVPLGLLSAITLPAVERKLRALLCRLRLRQRVLVSVPVSVPGVVGAFITSLDDIVIVFFGCCMAMSNALM